MSFIKKNWWKVLAVILLLYTFVFALVIPLSPKINRAAPFSLKTGKTTVILSGSNTYFTKNEQIAIGLEFEKKTYVCATNIKVLNKNQVSCEFDIPQNLPSKYLHLRFKSPSFTTFSPEIIKVFNSTESQEYPKCNASIKGKYFNLNLNLDFPNRMQLNETIRNLMFHVPMWFAMMLILTISFVYSLIYLIGFDLKNDLIAKEVVNIGLLFAVLGLVTGSIWAKFTWSEHTDLFTLTGWWVNDVKLNGAAITTLIYLAYRILRNSLEDEHQKAKISAVYSIFAFVLMVVFLMILPRLTDSLHPGNGGNPAFGKYDLDSTLKMVFYPAVIGWILLGLWMLNLKKRFIKLENKLQNEN